MDRFRWWMVPVALGLSLVAVVGVTVVLFLTREDPDPMRVEDVLEEFRASTASSPSTTPTSTTSTSATAPVTTPTQPEPGPLRPPEGVYVMAGEGRESISFPPVSQDDGAEIPATVRHAGEGCWTFTLFYNEAHWQDWDLCPGPEGATVSLVETGGHTGQDWDFGATSVGNQSTFVCDPPTPFLIRDAEPGASWDRSCRGTNTRVDGMTTSAGTLTFVGVDTLDIGGVEVEALRFRTENVLTGAQTGEDTSDLWFAAADGMPLRGERDYRVESDSPVGSIVYTEQGWWQLTSLAPER